MAMSAVSVHIRRVPKLFFIRMLCLQVNHAAWKMHKFLLGDCRASVRMN